MGAGLGPAGLIRMHAWSNFTRAFLEMARRLAAQWFYSRLRMTFPSVFLLFLWWWRWRLSIWVLLFSDLQEAIKKTVTLTLVFWVFCLRLSLFFSLCALFFFLGFLFSAPSFFLPPRGCLYPAFIRPETAPVVVTAGSNGVGRPI